MLGIAYRVQLEPDAIDPEQWPVVESIFRISADGMSAPGGEATRRAGTTSGDVQPVGRVGE